MGLQFPTQVPWSKASFSTQAVCPACDSHVDVMFMKNVQRLDVDVVEDVLCCQSCGWRQIFTTTSRMLR